MHECSGPRPASPCRPSARPPSPLLLLGGHLQAAVDSVLEWFLHRQEVLKTGREAREEREERKKMEKKEVGRRRKKEREEEREDGQGERGEG